MTKKKTPRPEPSADTGYDSYLWPRSKTPEKQAIYNCLARMGWRFDAVLMHWHTPEADPLQGFGRLEWDREFTTAKIVGPNPTGPDGLPTDVRPEPLLELVRTGSMWTSRWS